MESVFKIEALKSLLLTLVIGLWLYWLWTRRNFYKFAYRFPGSFGIPILGNIYTLRQPKDILTLVANLFMEGKQDTVCAWFAIYPGLLTCNPGMAEKILSSSELLNKAKIMYDSVNDITLNGLVTSPAEIWQHNRKIINPCFNHKVLIKFLPIFHKAKQHTLSKFEAMVGRGEQKLHDLLLQTSLGIAVETTMGKAMKENDEIAMDVSKKLTFLLNIAPYRMVLSPLGLNVFFSFYNRYQKSLSYVHNFVDQIIKRKLQCLHEIENKSNTIITETSKRSDDSMISIKKTPTIFIDKAIQFYQKQQFTWRDIISESVTIVIAAFETSSNAVFSTLTMLAMHPDVQEKLYEEIVGVFPEKDCEMEYEDLQKLPYLEMVINETLRLVPPVPLIARQAKKNTQLTQDILLPKDFLVAISIFHLHRNTDVWGPNANKFNPDNFLPENLQGKHSHAFMPFSKGARNCIGWRYAMFAMKVLLAGYVRNFRFTTTFKYEDLEFVMSLTLKHFVEPGIEIHRR